MFSLFRKKNIQTSSELITSSLFDEKTFYQSFIQDLQSCKTEVIIESPYITNKRMDILFPIFNKLVNNGIKLYIVTRSPKEHEKNLCLQAEREIQSLEALGVQVLMCVGNHHRKLAILDRTILYEGSLNILSYTKSIEMMRRIKGKQTAQEMIDFLKFEKFL